MGPAGPVVPFAKYVYLLSAELPHDTITSTEYVSRPSKVLSSNSISPLYPLPLEGWAGTLTVPRPLVFSTVVMGIAHSGTVNDSPRSRVTGGHEEPLWHNASAEISHSISSPPLTET